MLKYLGLFLLSVLLSGCAHTYRVRPDTPPATLEQVNRELEASRGTLHLQSGDSLRGAGFRIRPDSTLWYADLHSAPRLLPNHEIRRIEALDRVPFAPQTITTGAIAGGISGGVLGALGGFLAWAMVHSNEPNYSPAPPDSGYYPVGHYHHAELTLAEGLFYGALFGAGSGATLGATLGLLKASIDSYGGRPVMVRFRFPLDKP